MIDWNTHIHAAKEVLCQCPVGTNVYDATSRVARATGLDELTYDSLKDACRRYYSQSPSRFFGTRLGADAEISSVASAGTTAIPWLQNHGHVSACNDGDKQATPSAVTKVIATGDWHAPYHDKAAIEVLFAAMEAVKPDVVVLLGDIIDCFTVSKFSKDIQRRLSLKKEIAIVNGLLDRITAPTVYFTEGNHETRLYRYLIDNAPAVVDMLSLKKELRIAQRGWHWKDYRKEAVRIGKMSFKHDVGPAGKYSAHQSLSDYGGNICYGHSHRGATVYQSTVKGSHRMSLNTGWLGDVEAVDYRHIEMARRDYQLGFGLVYVDNATGNAFANFKPIIGGKCEIEGVLIGP